MLSGIFSAHSQVLKVGVVGLSHDHAYGLMQQFKKGEVVIIGIVESDHQLVDRYKKRYQLNDSLFYESTKAMLASTKPDAVLAYNPIADHLSVVEACAPKGISVMVEKPLAVTTQQADRIAALAHQYNVHVLTNYETTWFPSSQQLKIMIQEKNAVGSIRKMIAHDGHQGPKEIGCSVEFLNWLTDPEKNGGGAMVDFGCYGANLMTWLMEVEKPLAVTAVTRHIKPDIYPKVDDDATIILEYEGATGIIEASWNWPYGIKDLEVYGTTGYLQAENSNTIRERKKDTYSKLEAPPPAYTNNLTYLAAVLHGTVKPINDPSSLSINLMVVKILEAARLSAREGRRIILK